MTLRVEIKKLIMLEAVLNTQALFREKRNMKKGWLDITMLHNQFSHMRPVPTKWETSRKISFPSYKQIHDVQTLSFKMTYNMPGLLPYLGSKTHYFLEKLVCFLLIFVMFNKPYSFSSLATCRSFCENRSHMWSIIAMHGFWENNFLDLPLSQQAKLTFFHLHFVLFTL